MYFEMSITIWRATLRLDMGCNLIPLTWNPWRDRLAVGLEVGGGPVLISVSWDT